MTHKTTEGYSQVSQPIDVADDNRCTPDTPTAPGMMQGTAKLPKKLKPLTIPERVARAERIVALMEALANALRRKPEPTTEETP